MTSYDKYIMQKFVMLRKDFKIELNSIIDKMLEYQITGILDKEIKIN